MSKGVLIDFGQGKKAVFVPGGRKRFEIEKGYVVVNARARLADGTEHDALLEIDEQSSGEHGGTGIFVDGGCGITWQDDEDFLERMGKKKEQVFPYSYKYRAALHCHDHHVGDDGWSR